MTDRLNIDESSASKSEGPSGGGMSARTVWIIVGAFVVFALGVFLATR